MAKFYTVEGFLMLYNLNSEYSKENNKHITKGDILYAITCQLIYL